MDSNARLEQMILAHENERKLTVYEIHDGVIQYLVAAMMHIEVARSPERDLDQKVSDELAKAWRFLNRSLQEARSLMSSIIPPILEEQGIVAAVDHLVSESRSHHEAKVSFTHDVQSNSLSPLIEAALFRVAQQALANIWQHSNATEVAIELRSMEDQIQLTVSDSGRGFDPNCTNDGFGLQSMRSRVETLSGELVINSSEVGTRIIATLPTMDQLHYESLRRAQAEADKQQADESLSRRDQILSAVGFAASTFLKSANWKTALDAALERLGKAAQANRAYYFENRLREDGELVTSQVAEWAAAGIEAQIDNMELQDVPYIEAGMGRWAEVLEEGLPIHGLVEDFPASEREVLEAQDIRSLVAMPVFARNEFVGFLGFDDCQSLREWSSSEFDALFASSNALGAAIEREQLENQLRVAAEAGRR